MKRLTVDVDDLWEKWQQTKRERDEARQVVRYLVDNVVECWSYRAELAEAYPWLIEGEALTGPGRRVG